MQRATRSARYPPTKSQPNPATAWKWTWAGVHRRGPPPEQHEATEIQFGLKHHPDVKFRLVISTNGDKLDEPCSTRSRAEQTLAHIQHRFNKAALGPAAGQWHGGQELVEAIREADGARVHALDWEALGKPTDPTRAFDQPRRQDRLQRLQTPIPAWKDAQSAETLGLCRQLHPPPRTTSPPPGSPAPRTPPGRAGPHRPGLPETGLGGSAPTAAPVLGGSRHSSARTSPCRRSCCRANQPVARRVKGETLQFRRTTVWKIEAYPDDAAATHATAPDTAGQCPAAPADKRRPPAGAPP